MSSRPSSTARIGFFESPWGFKSFDAFWLLASWNAVPVLVGWRLSIEAHWEVPQAEPENIRLRVGANLQPPQFIISSDWPALSFFLQTSPGFAEMPCYPFPPAFPLQLLVVFPLCGRQIQLIPPTALLPVLSRRTRWLFPPLAVVI